MDIIVYKGRHIAFWLMNLHISFALMHLSVTILSKKRTLFWNIKVESDDGGHLESIDALGPSRRILIESCNQALTVQRKQNIVL